MVHLYWGDGKGKTTAAMGLALRALAAGQRVVIVQFLKGAPSGEVEMLTRLGATFYRSPAGLKFVREMTAAERAETRAAQTGLLREALREDAGLLILDEACAAWALDMVDRTLLQQTVESWPNGRELVLTGRAPAPWMRAAADYDTEMRCHRHPFAQGVTARRGVEF